MEQKPWRWVRPEAGGVRVDSGYIMLDDEWELYAPQDFPNLPNALAKVTDIKTAVDFVGKYGVLGYGALSGDYEDEYEIHEKKGEPVNWFLAQASAVRFALHLITALQDPKEKDLKRLITERTILVPLHEFIPTFPPEEVSVPAHLLPVGAKMETRPYRPLFQPDHWAGKHHSLGFQIVAYLVNANTAGLRRKLIYKYSPHTKEGRLVAQQSAQALIELIWGMVGDAALLSGEQKDQAVRVCGECGTPFVVTDRRQRFCPGDAFSRGSLCGARHRVRRNRRKHKKEE